jgi:hypothetical protein
MRHLKYKFKTSLSSSLIVVQRKKSHHSVLLLRSAIAGECERERELNIHHHFFSSLSFFINNISRQQQCEEKDQVEDRRSAKNEIPSIECTLRS